MAPINSCECVSNCAGIPPSSAPSLGTVLSDDNFASAVSECLRIASGNHVSDGLCTSASFGSMPSWDTSLVTNMSNAFSQYPDFNADISGWDASNVVDMSAMFESASLFDQDISSWVTSEVRSMTRMFAVVLVQSKHWGLLGYIASEEHGKKCFTKLLLSIRTSAGTHLR